MTASHSDAKMADAKMADAEMADTPPAERRKAAHCLYGQPGLCHSDA